MASVEDSAAPDEERPILLGLALDVSSSMAEELNNRKGDTVTRLRAVQDSLEDLVELATAYCEKEGGGTAPLFEIFAYGFGFGNLRDLFMRKKVPQVRDLFAADAKQEVVLSAQDLLDHWPDHRERIASIFSTALGVTPMRECLERIEARLRMLLQSGRYAPQPLIFLLSDGQPTDVPKEDPAPIVSLTCRLREMGALIVSCYIGSQDATAFRELYANDDPSWPPGARLLFTCASPLPAESPLWAHLMEHEWKAPVGARLFAQLNQSELLDEFVELLLSPLEADRKREGRPSAGTCAERTEQELVRIFISYSHVDSRYVSDEARSLLSFLRSLERDNVRIWLDRRLLAGDCWDDEIRREIEASDIALVLVSQSFLNSAYCADVEAASFVEARKKRGLRILPLVVSPCDWSSHPWLAQTQFLPEDGKTVEQHFTRSGARKALYLRVLRALRGRVAEVRAARKQKSEQ